MTLKRKSIDSLKFFNTRTHTSGKSYVTGDAYTHPHDLVQNATIRFVNETKNSVRHSDDEHSNSGHKSALPSSSRSRRSRSKRPKRRRSRSRSRCKRRRSGVKYSSPKHSKCRFYRTGDTPQMTRVRRRSRSRSRVRFNV